jgi:hypothetical protein
MGAYPLWDRPITHAKGRKPSNQWTLHTPHSFHSKKLKTLSDNPCDQLARGEPWRSPNSGLVDRTMEGAASRPFSSYAEASAASAADFTDMDHFLKLHE